MYIETTRLHQPWYMLIMTSIKRFHRLVVSNLLEASQPSDTCSVRPVTSGVSADSERSTSTLGTYVGWEVGTIEERNWDKVRGTQKRILGVDLSEVVQKDVEVAQRRGLSEAYLSQE